MTSLLKSNISKQTCMEQSVESNSLEKFKAIASLPILRPYNSSFFKKDFSENPVNLDMEITSTIQVELQLWLNKN